MRYFFFFNDTATTEIYTLSLHDALPILRSLHRVPEVRPSSRQLEGSRDPPQRAVVRGGRPQRLHPPGLDAPRRAGRDRKSTRLNSSHANISYAVFCLKKKIDMLHHLRSL